MRKKSERESVERERGRRKKGDEISKKNKKKKKKKKKLDAHTFSHRDPCTMTFRECKILAVLDCEE